MADIAQIDRIISEINELEENEKVLFFHKIEKIFGKHSDDAENMPIESVIGLWKKKNITNVENRIWGSGVGERERKIAALNRISGILSNSTMTLEEARAERLNRQ